MADPVITELDRRLRAACPPAAAADEHAFDGALLARVREQPIAARRSMPRAMAAPAVAGATLTAAAAVMLAGGSGSGGPSSAAAVTQALHWLNPPAGTILHTRSIETGAHGTTTMETWQSADDPDAQRRRFTGGQDYEMAGDAIYDPGSDTIYDPPGPAQAKPDELRLVADPIVQKVRTLLDRDDMTVEGRETHNGVDAWAISLTAGSDREAWTLWVSAADGKPLELRDPADGGQVIRWSAYEVLPDDGADRVLTLAGAHPGARVVDDPQQVDAVLARLFPDKGRAQKDGER
ncbi:MAG: hypothetical protein ACJ762_06095 [Solirubrobacteraceae bacterium]